MSNTPLNFTSGMPQMGAAFSGWQSSVTLQRKKQVISDFDTKDILENFTFRGVVQPLSPKSLSLKPEGERSFTWLQIHSFSGSLNLDTNDIIIHQGKQYKIMALLDYSLNNYIEYHAIEDFQNVGK